MFLNPIILDSGHLTVNCSYTPKNCWHCTKPTPQEKWTAAEPGGLFDFLLGMSYYSLAHQSGGEFFQQAITNLKPRKPQSPPCFKYQSCSSPSSSSRYSFYFDLGFKNHQLARQPSSLVFKLEFAMKILFQYFYKTCKNNIFIYKKIKQHFIQHFFLNSIKQLLKNQNIFLKFFL